MAKAVLTEARAKRIAAPIEPDGSQPLEVDRTRGINYSVMNLNGLSLLATVGERVGVDFWTYRDQPWPQYQNGAGLGDTIFNRGEEVAVRPDRTVQAGAWWPFCGAPPRTIGMEITWGS